MLGVLWATSTLICGGGLAARKMSTSCQRSNAASSEVRDSSSLVSAPQVGKSGKLTGCNQKRKARTDPRSDILHMQVIWEAVLLLLVLRRASSALVFRDGLLHRLAGGGGVVKRLEWDGDRNGGDGARRPQRKVLKVAAWPKPPRLHLKLKSIIKSPSNSPQLR